MQIGAQLYTLRLYTQTARDLDRAFARVAAIGYRAVQLSAIGAGIDAKTVRELLDRHGLRAVLTHTAPDRILYDTERVIEEHALLGCRYIGLGGMPDKYRSAVWVDHFAEDFLPAARRIRDAGMRFMYHNHAFEFERVAGGETLMDRILAGFAPDEMGVTLDTYWAHAAGMDVCALIRRLRDRIPCVHLKDMAVTGGKVVMAPVLEGNLDFRAIVRELAQTPCEYALVEQDDCYESPFACLEKSFRNLIGLGDEALMR